MLPIPPTFLAAGAVIALAIGGLGGWKVRDTSARAEVAALELKHTKALAAADQAKTAAVEEALSKSREAIARAEGIVRDAVAEEERLRVARAATVAESERLRDAAAAYQRRRAAACAAAAAGGGASGAMPDDMRDGDRLLRVFGECVGAHGSLAGDLGKSRASGLRCERWAAEVAVPTCQGK